MSRHYLQVTIHSFKHFRVCSFRISCFSLLADKWNSLKREYYTLVEISVLKCFSANECVSYQAYFSCY